MISKPIDFDNSVLTEFHHDVADDKVIINRVQDVEPILDANKAAFNQGIQHGRELRRVASIPNVVVERLMREGIWNDKERMRKWLNDPDNKYFRTSPEKV